MNGNIGFVGVSMSQFRMFYALIKLLLVYKRNYMLSVRRLLLSIYLSIYPSIYGSTVLLLDLGRLFSFLILHTVGRTYGTGDQPIARQLPTHRTT
jgi:sensor histidine kinase YesM